jgi:MOSC domain-containing protein YiiM
MVACSKLTLILDLGVQGDRHARAGSSRQVLLMAGENSDRFGLGAGEVRENIVTRGIDLEALRPGTRLRIGAAELEITRDCEPCAFIDTLRPGLRLEMLGRRGKLARVRAGGEIQLGDPITVVEDKVPSG